MFEKIKNSELKQKLFQENYCADRHGYYKLGRHIDTLGWAQKGVAKEITVLEGFSGTKHTKHEFLVKHFLQINRKNENVFNLYVFIFLYFYFCYYINIIIIIIINIIIIITLFLILFLSLLLLFLLISMLSLSALFLTNFQLC